MLFVVECPRCGKPAPICLSEAQRLRCPACSHDGPPAQHLCEQLARADSVVRQVAVGQRQLSDSQRRALASGCAGFVGFVALFGLVMLPFVGCFAFGIGVMARDYHSPVLFSLLFATPAVLMGVTGLLALGWIVRRRQRLEEACSALPPVHPGQPARCHVCGGPLSQPTGDTPVVRCAYCAADNLVRADVLERVGRKLKQQTGDLETQVRAASVQLSTATVASNLLVLGAALVVPVISTCVITFVAVSMAPEDRAADPSIEYAVLTTERGQCLAQLHRDGMGGAHLRRGMWASTAAQQSEHTSDASGLQVVTAPALVGRAATAFDWTEPGTIEAVYQVGMSHDGNSAWLRRADGQRASTDVKNLCLVPR